MGKISNREFWDFRVKTRAQFTKLAEQIANIDTSGGGGISELTSKMVVDALGYIPYDAANPAKYITENALSPYAKTEDIPSLDGYAKTEDIPTKVSQLTDSSDYLKKASAEATYATITSVTGFENRIKGLEGTVPQLNTKLTTLEGDVTTLSEDISATFPR